MNGFGEIFKASPDGIEQYCRNLWKLNANKFDIKKRRNLTSVSFDRITTLTCFEQSWVNVVRKENYYPFPGIEVLEHLFSFLSPSPALRRRSIWKKLSRIQFHQKEIFKISARFLQFFFSSPDSPFRIQFKVRKQSYSKILETSRMPEANWNNTYFISMFAILCWVLLGGYKPLSFLHSETRH